MIKNLVYGIMVFIQLLIRAAAQTDLCDCSDWLGVSTPFYSASPTFSVSLRALSTQEKASLATHASCGRLLALLGWSSKQHTS